MDSLRTYLVEIGRADDDWARLTVQERALSADDARSQVVDKLGDPWYVRAVRIAL